VTFRTRCKGEVAQHAAHRGRGCSSVRGDVSGSSGDRTLSAHDGRTSAHDPTTAGLLSFAAPQRAAHTLHIDVKKLGRSPDGGTWRAQRHTDAADRKRKQRNGSDYPHSLVNDHSRRVFGTFCRQQVITCADSRPCRGLLLRPSIAHIERVMTDNAWAYRHRHAKFRPHLRWQTASNASTATK
jgi:hypothetical protein